MGSVVKKMKKKNKKEKKNDARRTRRPPWTSGAQATAEKERTFTSKLKTQKPFINQPQKNLKRATQPPPQRGQRYGESSVFSSFVRAPCCSTCVIFNREINFAWRVKRTKDNARRGTCLRFEAALPKKARRGTNWCGVGW